MYKIFTFLCCHNFFIVLCLVLTAIAWAIIPLKFTFPLFRWESWQLFVAVCALPSLIIAFALFFFPESPKFLLELGEYEYALSILQKIFHRNTGNRPETYPVKTLRESRRMSLGGESIRSSRSIKSVKVVFSVSKVGIPPCSDPRPFNATQRSKAQDT